MMKRTINPKHYIQSIGYGCLLWASVSLFAACSDDPQPQR